MTQPENTRPSHLVTGKTDAGASFKGWDLQRILLQIKDVDPELQHSHILFLKGIMSESDPTAVAIVSLCVSSRFFTYGDLPLEQHLKQIDEEALSKFDRIDPNTQVPAQPRWSNPVGFQSDQ